MPHHQEPDDGGGFFVNAVTAVLSGIMIAVIWLARALGRIVYRTILEVRNEIQGRGEANGHHGESVLSLAHTSPYRFYI